MQAAKAFYSFSRVTDPAQHRNFNEWHNLDHRPENLLLPGVIWGERWVRSPDCTKAATINDDRFRDFHYFNIYWFRQPLAAGLSDWESLSYQSFHWGRRPDVAYIERPFIGWADPVKGYAATRTAISADAVPLRPNLGIHLTVSEFHGPLKDLDRTFQWHDQERIPQLLERKGTAGVWTAVASESSALPDWRAWASDKPYVRFQITWLDADPLQHADDLKQCSDKWSQDAARIGVTGVEKVLFSGPLRAIQPFQYDWFD